MGKNASLPLVADTESRPRIGITLRQCSRDALCAERGLAWRLRRHRKGRATCVRLERQRRPRYAIQIRATAPGPRDAPICPLGKYGAPGQGERWRARSSLRLVTVQIRGEFVTRVVDAPAGGDRRLSSSWTSTGCCLSAMRWRTPCWPPVRRRDGSFPRTSSSSRRGRCTFRRSPSSSPATTPKCRRSGARTAALTAAAGSTRRAAEIGDRARHARSSARPPSPVAPSVPPPRGEHVEAMALLAITRRPSASDRCQ